MDSPTQSSIETPTASALVVVHSRVEAGTPAATLTLPFEQRQRSRIRATLNDGREVAVFLERGQILRNGDLLISTCATCIEVIAGPESLSVAATADALALTRVAYHLGNRHVPLQVSQGQVSYLHDHVLDDMVRGFGVSVVHRDGPFEPEAGAYASPDGHGHGHAH